MAHSGLASFIRSVLGYEILVPGHTVGRILMTVPRSCTLVDNATGLAQCLAILSLFLELRVVFKKVLIEVMLVFMLR